MERRAAVPLGELRTRLGLGWGALYHHLRRLEEGGLVRYLRAGKRRLVVSTRTDARDEVLAALAEIHAARTASVARLIAEGKARDSESIALALDLSPRAARYHLARLHRAGLIEPATPGRRGPVQATVILLDALRLRSVGYPGEP